jgi:hypothetical protein
MGITAMTRSFRISDALVLVAATGIGLAGCGVWLSVSHHSWGDLWPTSDKSVLVGLWIAAWGAIPASSILLLSWTTAILLLRLRIPRPRQRHLWCQPGFLACVAAVFVFAWKSVVMGLFSIAGSLTVSPVQLSNINFGDLVSELALLLLIIPHLADGYTQVNVGGAVLLVWLVT